MRSTINILAWFTLLFFLSCSIQKEEKTYQASFFSSLYQQNDLSFEITTDLAGLIANKENEIYQPALFTSNSSGFPFNDKTIQIKTRGVTRKKICDFPPIMLKMSQDSLSRYGMAPFDKIKLVTHCNDSAYYEQLVIKEFVSYRLFNLVTDSSFMVKRATVTYRDVNNAVPDITKMAFLIEPDEEMADRLKGELDETVGPLRTVDASHYQKLVFFQYMIGNTDWNLSNRHNIRIVKPSSGPPFAVPYDFDYSGLVDAPYATSHNMLQLSSVRERLFQWRGSADSDFTPIVALFNDLYPAIRDLCVNTEGLSEGAFSDIIYYIDTFYDSIDSSVKIRKAIEKARG